LKKTICTCGKTKTPPYCDHSHDHKEAAATVKKAICTCGKTKTPPYCDHSHEHKEAEATVKKTICTCGKTKTPPYCDHSHDHAEHTCAVTSPTLPSPIPKKVLLMILPYWNPLIPPEGIARLKHYLQHYGYTAIGVDANVENQFKQYYDKYFAVLEKWIPENRRGNIYNIGNDVMREHMMAHINQQDENQYVELVKLILHNVFYMEINDDLVSELNDVLDQFYQFLENYFLDVMLRENPFVLGLSVFRDTLPASLFIFRLCKQAFPAVKTMMGGGVFSIQLLPESRNYNLFIEKTAAYIDKVIPGKGEEGFLEYLRELETPAAPGQENARPLDPPAPVPDHSDFDLKLYHYLAGQGSFSCPNRCSFCNVRLYYGEYRRKDPVQTASEMLALHEKHGKRLFFMLDSLINDVVTGMSEELLKHDASLYWDGYFRVERECSPEKALLWRRGGLYRVRMGIESGSQKVLDMMDKNITVDHVRETVTSLAYAGIKTTAYIVIGHPGETEEDFQKTLDLMTELKNDIWEAECNPFTYSFSGQAHSDRWENERRSLYPQWADHMLLTPTWILETQPSRQETFERIFRFVEHCKKLGISTPWSLKNVNQSDERWRRLHKNAVPPLIKLVKGEDVFDECKSVKPLLVAKQPLKNQYELDF
jgi:CDGSH-type Zn-finger protein